ILLPPSFVRMFALFSSSQANSIRSEAASPRSTNSQLGGTRQFHVITFGIFGINQDADLKAHIASWSVVFGEFIPADGALKVIVFMGLGMHPLGNDMIGGRSHRCPVIQVRSRMGCPTQLIQGEVHTT